MLLHSYMSTVPLPDTVTVCPEEYELDGECTDGQTSKKRMVVNLAVGSLVVGSAVVGSFVVGSAVVGLAVSTDTGL